MEIGIIGGGTAAAQALLKRLTQEHIAAELIGVESLAGGDSLPQYLVYCGMAPEPVAPELAPAIAPGWRDELAVVVGHCRQGDRGLVFLSSSQVYEGTGPVLHLETDAAVPKGEYAQALAEAGALVRDGCRKRLVLRLGPLIAGGGPSPLAGLLPPLLAGETLELDNQQQVFPTPVDDLARVALAALKQLDCGAQRWGTYHYQSSEWGTWYQLADAVLALTSQYRPVPGCLLARGEPAPVFGGGLQLSCRKLLNTFGIKQRPWRPALAAMVQEALAAHQS